MKPKYGSWWAIGIFGFQENQAVFLGKLNGVECDKYRYEHFFLKCYTMIIKCDGFMCYMATLLLLLFGFG